MPVLTEKTQDANLHMWGHAPKPKLQLLWKRPVTG